MFNTFFRKSCHVWDNWEKYATARKAAREKNIAAYKICDFHPG
jgi:hypothetical protein